MTKISEDNIKILALEILSDCREEIDLFEFDDYIKQDDDIDSLFGFFDSYNEKYISKLFSYNVNDSIFKKNDKNISNILKNILSLGPGKFEKLSAILCKYFGYDNYYATQISHDEGIDFIAFKEIEKINIDFKNHIIGQSKNFENTSVKIKDIRELAGSISLFSRKEFSTFNKKYTKFNIKLFSPVYAFFVSSYFFSEPAYKLCYNSSIIPIDIIDIVSICTVSMNKAIYNWKKPNGDFDEIAFNSDINNVKIYKD